MSCSRVEAGTDVQWPWTVWARMSRRSAVVQGIWHWLGYFRVGDGRIEPRALSDRSIGDWIDTSQQEHTLKTFSRSPWPLSYTSDDSSNQYSRRSNENGECVAGE